MNDSLNVYLKYYLVVYILGYLLEKLISVLKIKLNKVKIDRNIFDCNNFSYFYFIYHTNI